MELVRVVFLSGVTNILPWLPTIQIQADNHSNKPQTNFSRITQFPKFPNIASTTTTTN